MSVSASNLYYKPVQIATPARLKILKKKGIDIPFEFRLSSKVTGDASGGNVSFTFDVATNLDKSLYYVLTKIYSYDIAGANHRLIVESDRWDNTYEPNIANETIALWASAGVYAYHEYKNTITRKPIYLGRPRNADGDAGKFTYQMATNTDTYDYLLTILGFAMKDPLPLAGFPELFL